MLAKELGLLATDPESKRQQRKHQRRREEHQRLIRLFEAWRDGHVRCLSAELRRLGRAAAIATDVLNSYPDCEPAWDAFARFCHQEGELNRQLDWLTCAKASPWLDADSTILDVFEAWRRLDEKR
jgi:hypothetical protein